jgi:hypothetical protein
VQRCKLSGLPDLNTGSPNVQNQLSTYLQDLLDRGVKGFRIDGSKHMAAGELGMILDGLTLPGGGKPFIYHEVIDTDSSERVRDWEYIPHGAVQEFEYSITAMGEKFNNCNSGSISQLQNIPLYDDMMASQFAVIFTDNHDNQRGHGPGGACVVDHRDGQTHQLANIFMLAYPYGYPMITSSYYWTTNPNSDAGDSLGPPSTNGGTTWGVGLGADTRPVYGAGQNAGDVPVNCSANYPSNVLNAGNLGSWVCEHRNNGIANMVLFRQVTHGQDLTNWWDNGDNHIAFGRGAKGFVAINNSNSGVNTTYQTSLPAGVYCNIIAFNFDSNTNTCVGATVNDLIVVTIVGSNREIQGKALAAKTAFAIHTQAQIPVSGGDGTTSYPLAWHVPATGDPILGNTRTTKTDLGNDVQAADGVVPTAGVNWQQSANGGSVDVTVTGADGYVTGWIDWDNNGNFTDIDDEIFSNEPFTAGLKRTITFDIPVDPRNKTFQMRFRVYPNQQLNGIGLMAPLAAPSPSGGAMGGEVEDYAASFGPLAVTLQSQGTTANTSPTAVYLLLLLGLMLVTFTAVRRHTR